MFDICYFKLGGEIVKKHGLITGLVALGLALGATAGPAASAGGTANCHTGPGAAFPVATKIPADHSLAAIETFDGWSKVNANGTRCWALPGKPVAARAKAKVKPKKTVAQARQPARAARPTTIRRTVTFYNESVKNPQYSTWSAPVYSAYDPSVGYGYRYPSVTR